MLRVYTGDDRVRAQQEIIQFLGNGYEIVEGAELSPADLPSLFQGASLFAETRNILIRDLSANKPVYDKLPDYLNTPHRIALLETKLDKRSATYKAIKSKVEIYDFPLAKNPNLRRIFDIYATAKHDGQRAIQMLRTVQTEEDPIMFFGLLASSAFKDYAARQGTKERKALKSLSQLDLELKSTSVDPWLLIESFLLRLPQIFNK